MKFNFSPETRKLIEQSMRNGGYSNADDVVRAGLESLQQQQLIGEFDAGELDELLAEGERSGPPLDGDLVLEECLFIRHRLSF